MKIAIIGTGIAGNVAAYHLHKKHDITVFEAGHYIGGHTNTVDVDLDGRSYAVDTGFIVFNDWTYPHFIKLMNELNVPSQPSSMGFSMRCQKTGLEYNGSSLNALFTQRLNVLKPSFHRMIRDILRFNREATHFLEEGDNKLSLGEYLFARGYGREFVDHYVIPMGAAIWSADPVGLLSMPARFFVRFFNNHGLLSVKNRPTWRVIKGGSRSYVEPLVAAHRHKIRLGTAVRSIRRFDTHVEVSTEGNDPECFDQVFVACHSDQALAMLTDATTQERDILGAIPYQYNEAVLHTDVSLMPSQRRAWAAWNYHVLDRDQGRVSLTYNMNILQGLDSAEQFCVTLNNSDAIDPARIIQRIDYEHPVFTAESVAAQRRHGDINGINRTYFCGAYWRNGFHEDGVVSALKSLEHFEERAGREELYLRRAG
ncbi:MAG: NAD(P)/FAD-dependent oxidoreductase [Gammaproteobacteria bacterium]